MKICVLITINMHKPSNIAILINLTIKIDHSSSGTTVMLPPAKSWLPSQVSGKGKKKRKLVVGCCLLYLLGCNTRLVGNKFFPSKKNCNNWNATCTRCHACPGSATALAVHMALLGDMAVQRYGFLCILPK